MNFKMSTPWRREFRRSVCGVFLTLLAAAPLQALESRALSVEARDNGQALGWQPEFYGPGLESATRASTVFQEELVVGGLFRTAGDKTVNYIVRWDGSQWHALSSGMDGPVFALTVHDGDLVAAGLFTTAGGTTVNRIARWDGTQWHALSSGMDGAVSALTVHDDALIAGGSFTTAGGEPVNRIAHWDGSQ